MLTRRLTNLSKLKVAAGTSFILYAVFIFDLKMAITKIRHIEQVNVKNKNIPRLIEELPDLSEDQSQDTTGLCPKKPPDLVGALSIDVEATDLKQLSQKYVPFRPGGLFRPKDCVSRTKVAIIIPYRNRKPHLVALLNHLVPFLVRQQAEFNIFVVEPIANVTFNRALLMNIGFVEALKTNNFTCFIFHDVDLLAESDFNMYRCGDTPRHMAAAMSSFGYQLPYLYFAGGAIAIPRKIYEAVNGHSNLYFGWGGEDDDMLYRLSWMQYNMSRFPENLSRYTAIFHKKDVGNDVSNLRFQLLWTLEKRMNVDGLNSLQYSVVKLEHLQLYTKILVDIDVNYYTPSIEKFT